MKHYWMSEGVGLDTYYFNLVFPSDDALDEFLASIYTMSEDGVRQYDSKTVYAVNCLQNAYEKEVTLRSIECFKRH